MEADGTELLNESLSQDQGRAVVPQKDIIIKALQLLVDKHSVHMTERHVRALERISIHCSKGFFLCDVPDLCAVLAVVIFQLPNHPEYEEPLLKIIHTCRQPFLKQLISDEVKYSSSVVELMVLFGKLLNTGSSDAKQEITEVVGVLFSEIPEDHSLEGLQVTKLSFNTNVVEKSGLARSFVNALKNVSNLTLKQSIMKTLQVLSSSENSCKLILSAHGAKVICETISLDIKNPKRDLISLSIQTLWNIIEKGSSEELKRQISSIECIRVLQESFRYLMTQSCSHGDRQLRNDLLVLCSLIASKCPGAPLLETGFLSELYLFATFPEVNRPNEKLLKNVKLLNEPEDFELKKLFMSLLPSFVQDTAAIEIMSDYMVLLSLFSYVVPNDKSDMHWQPAQFEELQLLSLSVLSALAPHCTEDYITCQGNTRLLIMLEWCLQEESFGGYGNSFHGDGGRGTHFSQLRYSLRLLLSVMSTGDSFLHEEFCDQGGISILIHLLNLFSRDSGYDSDTVAIEMQNDAIMILSCICDDHLHIKELFGSSGGIEVLIQYLKMDIKKFSSGLGHQRLLISVIDCIWSAVVGNFKNEDLFLEHEGMFLTLDLLEFCPNNMQGVVLGVIVDLCENLKAVPHVSSWRGKRVGSTWSLMAHLWRSEEKEMMVSRGQMDTLSDTSQPLTGSVQLECTSSLKASSGSSLTNLPPVISDVMDNLRAKIFSLCSKMGFQFCPHDLPIQDKVSLFIVERYLDFKTGEAWSEVMNELAAEGLEPVAFDEKMLQEIKQITEAKAEKVSELQFELIQKKMDKEKHEEEEFYEKVKHYHQQEERTEEKFEDYLKRTSDYQYLKTSRLRRERELEASKGPGGSISLGDRFHSTDIPGLNVTAFSGRNVSVTTVPMKLTCQMGVEPDSSKTKPLLATWNAAEYGRSLMGH